ncbi:Gfo/Idh/MocA family protein [Haloarchaeobius sp. FL176]|uniref:Gfo/Idh/MocA family protein n=1 Tax=Haloarchaeobius sp. FL176 TaxID=2967129 RepID=UPI002148A34D|nr:Gfo/Idh/MocA family oxidoreductase [Haloarchaeobius sp. FL176]
MSEDGTTPSQPLAAGVVGVGSMGRNHARVYDELGTTRLAGVYDADRDRSESVASEFDTSARKVDALLDVVDVVSIAVPTEYHFELARRAVHAGVDVLVEKPFVEDIDRGRALVRLADQHDVAIQIGHVERFNPTVSVLRDIVEELEVIAVDGKRLGPPPERRIPDSAVMDLMIHDVDLVWSLLDGSVDTCSGYQTADGRHAVGTLEFDTDTLCTLTASRVSREEVRRISVSAKECRVTADLLEQTVEVHRKSEPEYASGEVADCRGGEVVEQVSVADDEPLERELRSFTRTVLEDGTPTVSGEEGLRVLEMTRAIEEATDRQTAEQLSFASD